MLKFLSIRNLNLKIYESLTSRSNKKNLKTVIRPIQEKVVKNIETITTETLYNPNILIRNLKLLFVAIPSTAGLYFAFKGMWENYLTYNKRISLNMLSYSTIGFSAVLTGTIIGNYLQLARLDRVKSAFIPSRMNILLLLSLSYFLAAEFIDRNVFIWGAGTLTLACLLGNFILLREGNQNKSISFNIIKIFKFPCFITAFLSSFMFIALYRERSKESLLVSEFKEREKFVNHINFK